MNGSISSKILRRVCAAEGYLELGMPAQALAELDGLENPGVLTPHVLLLRGTSLMAQERYDEAIDPLQHAARTVPAPYDRLAWWSLSKCFESEGWTDLATIAQRFAELPPEEPHNAVANLLAVVMEAKRQSAAKARESGENQSTSHPECN